MARNAELFQPPSVLMVESSSPALAAAVTAPVFLMPLFPFKLFEMAAPCF